MKKCRVPLIVLFLVGMNVLVGNLSAQLGPNPPGPPEPPVQIAPPVIVSRTSGGIVPPGSEIALSVVARGEGNLRYQWFFNGMAIRRATNPSLTIPAIDATRVGTYYVIVANEGGSVRSDNMNISIKPEPPTGVGFPWASNYVSKTPGFHRSNDLITDSDGNAYVVGEAPGENGNPDFIILKYDRNGNELWSRLIDLSEGGRDIAIAIALAPSNGLVVLGTVNDSLPNSQIVALGLTRDGEDRWETRISDRRIRGARAAALATDPTGGFLITGTAAGPSGADIITARLGTDGTQVWSQLFDGGARDTAASVAVDQTGTVFVVGTTQTLSSGDDIISILYNQRGAELWTRTVSGIRESNDIGTTALFDASNRPIVVGAIGQQDSGLDFFVRVYTRSGGEGFSVTETSRGNIADIPVKAFVDASGAIIIAGNSQRNTPGTEGLIVKVSRQGEVEWGFSLPTQSRPGDHINDLVETSDGGFIVGGDRINQPFGSDMAVANFDLAGRDRWDGRLPLIDEPVFETVTAVAVDPQGDVLVTGFSNLQADSQGTSAANSTQIITLKIQVVPPAQNANPVVTILQPADGETATFGSEITIVVAGRDQEGPIQRLEVLVGNEVIGSGNRSPLVTQWTIDRIGEILITARVTDSDGTVVTAGDPVEINVPDISPVIVSFPSDQAVAPGASLSLEAVVTGDEPLLYQWLRNARPIPGANSDTLVIDNFNARQAGRYELVVRNRAGNARSPQITIELDIPSVVAGDNFADRVSLGGESGQVKVSTINATREPGEPQHANKRGSHSVWFSFVATAQGLVTLNTIGANFDTLLAVYTGTELSNLTEVTNDEDGGGFLTSDLKFRAEPDQEYIIVIDGFNQQEGTALLEWSFDRTIVIPVPRFTISPDETVARPGSNVTLTASFTGPQPVNATFQWLFNDREIPGETRTTLQVNNVGPRNAGQYWLRANVGNVEAFSNRARLSISARRAINVLTVPEVKIETKFADLFLSFLNPLGQAFRPLRRPQPVPLAASVATGFSGAQIFNTFGAVKELGEPDHCDVPGGASQWFAYQPPIDGSVVMSTEGSDFDTVMAVYVADSADFTALTEVACDNDSGVDGLDSLLTFDATADTIYYIAVDGVEAATGIVEFSYAMDLPLTLSIASTAGSTDAENTAPPFTYTVTGVENVDVVIEASDDLETWTSIFSGQLGEGGVLQVEDDEFSAGKFSRYFRVYYP